MKQLCIDTFEHPYKEDRVEIEALAEFSTAASVEAFAVSSALARVKGITLEECDPLFHHHISLEKRLSSVQRKEDGSKRMRGLIRQVNEKNTSEPFGQRLEKLAKACNIEVPQSLRSIIEQRFDKNKTGVISGRNLSRALTLRYKTLGKADVNAVVDLVSRKKPEESQWSRQKSQEICYLPLVSFIDNSVIQAVDEGFVVQKLRNMCEIANLEPQHLQDTFEKTDEARRKKKRNAGEVSVGNFVKVLLQTCPLSSRDVAVLLATFAHVSLEVPSQANDTVLVWKNVIVYLTYMYTYTDQERKSELPSALHPT